MRWLALFRNLLKRRHVEEELDADVQAHFDLLVERHIARGLSPEEARRAVRIAYESQEEVKEKVRDVRMGTTIEMAFRDLRYAVRVLAKNPGFTIVAVLTLALGIGANTAIFSLINAVMIRMLPVENPAQLVLLTDPASIGISVDTTENRLRERLSYPEFEQLRAHNTVFSGLLAAENQVNTQDLIVANAGNTTAAPVKVRTQLVSGEFFDVLGVRPILGRVFTSEEDKVPGANPVAVISNGFWKRQLDGKPDVLGTSVRIGHGVFQIVGIAPPGFHGILVGSDTDVWVPIMMQAQLLPGHEYLKPHDTLWLQVMARLSSGMPVKTAESAVNVEFQQILRGWLAELPSPEERKSMLNQHLQLRTGASGASTLRGEFSDSLQLLMAMVGVVLLIACANIANLMLAKATSRQREIGVRIALGAARSRVIRQLVTESLVVAILGGAAGVLVALAGTRYLLAAVAGDVSDLGLENPLDYRVLFFTAGISLITGLAFGLAPAIRATRVDLNRTLSATGRSLTGTAGTLRTGRILVVAQVALSLVLVMSAALLVRSLNNMLSVDLGYERDHMLMVRVDPSPGGYEGVAATALYTKLLDGMRSIPGVRDVSLSNTGLFGNDAGDPISVEGSPVRETAELHARWTQVGPNYFRTVGIPLLRGREVDDADASHGAPVCLVNEAFVKRFFPGVDPIGRHVTDEYVTTRWTFEVIGVVADSKEHLPTEPVRPRFYANLARPIGTIPTVTFLLRSAGDPATVGTAVRARIASVDSGLPIVSLRTLTGQIDRRLLLDRLMAQLAAFFGIVALFMASIGLYGVISYSMNRRKAEIGIRMALGASGRSVIRMVLGEAVKMVAMGAAIGLPCALLAARLVSSRLFGLTPADPLAMVVAVTVILAAGIIAAYLPAQSASRIDPIVSLKCD